jgi:hypothetical protein
MGGEQQEVQQSIKWYEVDHVSVVQEKAASIRESELLSSYAPNLTNTQHGFCSHNNVTMSTASSYHLVGHDLRDSPAMLLEKLKLNPSLPTLFVLECVFMYLPLESSQEVLRNIAKCADEVYMACYEPILNGVHNNSAAGNRRLDPFGQMMEQNLTKAKVATPDSCLLQTRTLKDQLDKLMQCRFQTAVGCDMWSSYQTILSHEQRTTANHCEFLDEYEEWIMIMQHYCFVVGTVSKSNGEERKSRTDTFTAVTQQPAKDPSLLGFVEGKCLKVAL